MKFPKMKWFKLKPQDPAAQFIGKKMTCYPTYEDAKNRTNAETLLVEHICGNLTHQTCFQINGSHLVSMLDAYCELNKEPKPTQEMHEDFLSTKAEVIQEDKHGKAKQAGIDR